MPEARHVWSLVLAGGDGNRLRALTTKPCGTSVPKQYCSLHGGHSLLEDAIARAQRVVAPDRVCTIVAQQHREWWTECPLLLEAMEAVESTKSQEVPDERRSQAEQVEVRAVIR